MRSWLRRLGEVSLLVAASSAAAAPAAPRNHRVARNREYGIEARFPAGTRICEALSGFHPTGFFAWLDRPTNCNIPQPASVSKIDILASYNAPFYKAPSLSECASGNVPPGLDLDLRGLTIGRLRSISCAVRRPDGAIEVFVAAQGGRWRHPGSSPEFRTPLINYLGLLRTHPDRVGRDFATFRVFLSRLRIRTVLSD